MPLAAPPPLDLGVNAEADAERAKLQKHFGRADIFFFLVCTLVGIDGLGQLSTAGAAGFTWLLLAVVVFAVPSAFVLAELGAAYTDEGGPYVWVRMAFGHLAGAVNNFFYWVTNPVWMGGTLVGTATGGLFVFFNDDKSFSTTTMWLIGIPFIWLGVLFAVLSFKVGKWIATVGAIARFLLLGFFTVLVIVYGAKHGVHGLGVHDFTHPTYSSFVLLVPLILFSLVGFELPSAAGEEMEDPAKDVPSGIAKSVLATALLYGLPVLGILVVLPSSQANGLAGFPDAIKQSLTVFGGHVTVSHGVATSSLSGAGTVLGWLMGILIPVVAFTSGLTWIMGSDRTLAVSCYDGAGPMFFGKFSARFGTPLRVNVLSGVVSTVVFGTTEIITGGNAYKFFSVALNLAVSTTLISYLGIFPAAWVLRRKLPDHLRPYRSPWLPLTTILSTAAIVFSTIEILFPGAGDQWFGPNYVFSDQWHPDEKWTYLLTVSIPLASFIVVAVAFWAAGRRHRLGTPRRTPPPGLATAADLSPA